MNRVRAGWPRLVANLGLQEALSFAMDRVARREPKRLAKQLPSRAHVSSPTSTAPLTPDLSFCILNSEF
jgi:hypothetical protein